MRDGRITDSPPGLEPGGLGLFGAGLLFGDGAITPAISVLGAMEGLSEQGPALSHLVVPITIAILVALGAGEGARRKRRGGQL